MGTIHRESQATATTPSITFSNHQTPKNDWWEISPKFCAQTHLSILNYSALLFWGVSLFILEKPRTIDFGPLQPHTLNQKFLMSLESLPPQEHHHVWINLWVLFSPNRGFFTLSNTATYSSLFFFLKKNTLQSLCWPLHGWFSNMWVMVTNASTMLGTPACTSKLCPEVTYCYWKTSLCP